MADTQPTFTIHELKVWPRFFEALLDRSKTFEFRKNDRNFQVGDLLVLKEWDPDAKDYTGRWLHREITYVLSDWEAAIAADYVILGLMDFDRRQLEIAHMQIEWLTKGLQVLAEGDCLMPGLHRPRCTDAKDLNSCFRCFAKHWLEEMPKVEESEGG